MKFANHTRVLVTGACGFIGSHLVEKLVRSGCVVKALTRYSGSRLGANLESLDSSVLKSTEVLTGNIHDPFFVRKALRDCSVVFHLAALSEIPYSLISPASYVETNLEGTFNVLQACLDQGVSRIVHVSSAEVYGMSQYTPVDECHPLQARSPYAATKIAGEKLAESYYHSYQLPVVIARPFNTYGPRQSTRALIPSVIEQIASRQKKLRIGSITPIRDFTYVSDVVEALFAASESDQLLGQAVNIGSSIGVSVNDVVCEIMDSMDAEVEVVCDEDRMRAIKNEAQALICDNSKIRSATGWLPRYSLQEGLKETIAYYNENQINQNKVGVSKQ